MSWGFFSTSCGSIPVSTTPSTLSWRNGLLVMLGQNIAGAIAEAVGYTGLLQFVLRAPDDEPDRKWRWLERLLPVIAIVLRGVDAAHLRQPGAGFRTESGTRFAILAGFAVAVCAVGMSCLSEPRRKPPEDFQRMRVGWCGDA